MHGRHILLDLAGCACEPALLERHDVLERLCVAACRDAGMTVVGQAFHQFAPTGVTGVVLLAESHLAVHTWPEQRFVAADVYVCDHLSANAAKGRALADALCRALAAAEVRERDVLRGAGPAPTRAVDDAAALPLLGMP